MYPATDFFDINRFVKIPGFVKEQVSGHCIKHGSADPCQKTDDIIHDAVCNTCIAIICSKVFHICGLDGEIRVYQNDNHNHRESQQIQAV